MNMKIASIAAHALAAAMLAASWAHADEGLTDRSRQQPDRGTFMASLASTQTGTHASPAQEGISSTVLENTLRLFIGSHTAGFPGRVEIEVGTLARNSVLAPCANMEPFIPAGTRLWGRASLGMRCRDGARWSVLVPVHVRIFAPALISTRSLAPGQALAAEDYEIAETELTRQAPGMLTSPDEVASQILSRPLPSGTALRREHFRPQIVAAPGDQVTLTYAGSGFAVSGSGKALHAAADGQPVRVQVESGRILTGIARHGRRVEVRF